MSLKIIFAGTPDFAAQHLNALLQTEHEIIAVYTQPDKPAGRGKKLTASPVKQLALAHNIPVFQPKTLRDETAWQELVALNADVMVVVAYGLILPKAVLDAPPLGCLNVHGSLLPKWRGAAPIQRSLWAGDKETGITIMQMDEGLDTGDMLHKVVCPIENTDTSATLYDKLARLAPPALIEVLNGLKNNQFPAQKQLDSQATHAAKLSKEEARMNWDLSAEQLERNIRAFNPWPFAYFEVTDDKGVMQNVKLWQAEVLPHQNATPGKILSVSKNGIQVATADGVLNITQLQIPGKKPMSVQDFLNGRQWFNEGDLL